MNRGFSTRPKPTRYSRDINNINSHEEIISSTLKLASKRFDKVNKRLNNFKKRCKNETQSQENIEWIRQYRNLNEEESSLSKLSKNTLKLLVQVHVQFEPDTMFCHDESMVDMNADACKQCIGQRIWDLRNQLQLLQTSTQTLPLQVHQLGSKKNMNDTLKQLQIDTSNKIKLLKHQHIQVEKEIRENRAKWDNVPSETQPISKELRLEINSIQCLCNDVKEFGWIDEYVHKNISLAVSKVLDSCEIKPHNVHKKHHLLLQDNNESRTKIQTLVDKNKERGTTKKDYTLLLDKIQNLNIELMKEVWKGATKILNNALNEVTQFRLDFLRQINEITQNIESEDIMKRQCKRVEEEKVFEDRKEKQRLLTNNKLEAYNSSKHIEQMKQRKEEERSLQQEENQRKERLANDIERVKFRRDELLRKNEKRLNAMEETRKKKVEREEKLNELAASVPYHSSIIAKKSDLSKSTAARLNDIFESSSDSELKDFQQGLKKMTGFTNQRVFSDPKFRLAHALHESGKAKSAYSLAVVRQLIPREEKRRF